MKQFGTPYSGKPGTGVRFRQEPVCSQQRFEVQGFRHFALGRPHEHTAQFEWSEDLRTGNDIMDIQHKVYFFPINSVLERLEVKNEPTMSDPIVNLMDYAFDRFVLEERLMLKTDYPDFVDHRVNHSHYIKFVSKLKHQLIVTTDLIEEVRKEFLDWLADHFLDTGKKIAEHFRKYNLPKHPQSYARKV